MYKPYVIQTSSGQTPRIIVDKNPVKKTKHHSLVLKSSGITVQAQRINFSCTSEVVSTHTEIMLHRK